MKNIYFVYSTIIHAVPPQLKHGVQYGINRHLQKCITSHIRISPPTKARKDIYIYIHTHTKGSHLYLLVQITTKHRKCKRLPFKCHCLHSKSTLTIQRTPHPQKRHHQISTADLPAYMQSSFIIMLNTQYVQYHI